MNQLLKYTLLLFLVTFAACSSEDDAALIVSNRQPQPGDALELIVSTADFVTDGAPDTRATDNDKTTTFGDGDRVGIIILDKDDAPIYNNIPYKYKNGKWTFDSNNDEGKGECYYDSKATTYIVYYPYSRAADGVTSIDDLKAKFAPKFDQSDIKDYRASDLMVWSSNTHLTFSEKVLNAELKHAFVSVYLALMEKYKLEDEKKTDCSFISLNISDVSLTLDNIVYVPFQATDGSLRCIVPADIISPSIRYFYTFGSKTYGNTITIQNAVKSNTRYTSKPVIIYEPYTLVDAKIGDFYCKRSDNNEGYLIPGDAVLTEGQKKACIGIVFKAGIGADDGVSNYGEKLTTIHGYAVALHDAYNEAGLWGIRGILSLPPGVYTFVNKYDGYKNTATVRSYPEYASTDVTKPQNLGQYWAFKVASEYNVTVPQKTSGWYMPSVGQFYDIDHMPQRSKLFDMAKGDDLKQPIYWVATEKNSLDVWIYEPNKGSGQCPKKGDGQGNDSYAYVRSILTF